MRLSKIVPFGCTIWAALFFCAYAQAQVGKGDQEAKQSAAKYTPTETEVERGRQLLQNYERNRKQVSRYACAMFVDRTHEDFEKPQNTSHAQDWYFHAWDSTKNIARQDELVLRTGILAGLNGEQVSLSDQKSTLFVTDQDVIQVSNARSNNSISTKDAKDEDFDVLRPQALPNPWMIPFHGSLAVDLQLRIGSVRKKFYLDVKASEIEILNFDEVGRFSGVEFAMPGESALTWKAVFDKESGDMPIRVERIIDQVNYSGIMGVGETEWIHVDNLWLPQKVNLESKIGPPQKPVGLSSHRTDLYWVLGDNVPEDVFVTTPPDVMRPAELKQAILEFAVGRKK